MRKQLLPISLLLFIIVFLFSCEKESGITSSSFYGKWKANYGDTVVFARINGKNLMNYDLSMNPGLPANTYFEYTYSNNKLGIKDGLGGPIGFHYLQSFRWLEEGRSFEIQGVEWFPFISSTATYFTLTKIP